MSVNNKNVLYEKLYSSAQWATILMVLGLLVSTALISLSELYIALMCCLLVLLKKSELLSIKQSITAKVGLLFFFVIVFQALITTPRLLPENFEQVGRYRELLLLPMLILLLNSNQWKKKVYFAFLIGMGAILLHSYLQYFSLVPNSSSLDEPNTSTVGRIAGAIMLAFTCFAYLEEALRSKNNSVFWGWVIMFILASYALLFFYNGRTGLIIYFALLFIWGGRFFGKKGVVLSFMLISIISVSIYKASPAVQSRIHQTYSQSLLLVSGEPQEYDYTRVGLYLKTIDLIQRNSVMDNILGSGTGSFVYEANIKNYDMDNPHNQYMLSFFENGILGLVLLILFFATAWKESYQLGEHQKWLLRALIITMSIGCIFNSLLMDNREAHFYVLLLATLLPLYKPKVHNR